MEDFHLSLEPLGPYSNVSPTVRVLGERGGHGVIGPQSGRVWKPEPVTPTTVKGRTENVPGPVVYVGLQGCLTSPEPHPGSTGKESGRSPRLYHSLSRDVSPYPVSRPSPSPPSLPTSSPSPPHLPASPETPRLPRTSPVRW